MPSLAAPRAAGIPGETAGVTCHANARPCAARQARQAERKSLGMSLIFVLVKKPNPLSLMANSASLRVVQLNVKRFSDKHGQSTAEVGLFVKHDLDDRLVPPNAEDPVRDPQPAWQAIADALADLRPSVVCFNEVDTHKQPEALDHISRRLGMRAEFFGHVRARYGNALLSSLPIRAVTHHHLR